MNENQTPWAAAVERIKGGGFFDRTPGGMETIIREACERHCADLRAENERLRKEHDYMHRTLLNREESLKQAGNDWVKAKTETDTVKAERDALAAKVEQLEQELSVFRSAKNISQECVDLAERVRQAADATPPAVVPAAEVEPLISLMETFLQWTKENLPGAEFDPQHILDAYRKKHPKPESKA